MKKLLAMALMTTTLLAGSMTAFAQYGSGNVSGTVSGKPWSGRYVISTTQVYGSVTCATAHDVAAIGHVYYKENGLRNYEKTSNVADPGTSAVCVWNAGSGRVVQSSSNVVVQVEGGTVSRN